MLNPINVLAREINRLEGNLQTQEAHVKEKQEEVDRARAGAAKIERDIFDLRTAISILHQRENSVAGAG